MINLLLLDSQDGALQGIKNLFTPADNIYFVGQATTTEDAVLLSVELKPDVLLMYPRIPGIHRVAAIYKMRRNNPTLKVIAVISTAEDDNQEPFIQAGTHGYVTPQASKDELIQAIQKVYGGEIYVAPGFAEKIVSQQVREAAKAPFANLSKRELQVMTMLMHGVRITEIANKLLLSAKTVNTYRYRLFDKLNVENNVKLARLAMSYGMHHLNVSNYFDPTSA